MKNTVNNNPNEVNEEDISVSNNPNEVNEEDEIIEASHENENKKEESFTENKKTFFCHVKESQLNYYNLEIPLIVEDLDCDKKEIVSTKNDASVIFNLSKENPSESFAQMEKLQKRINMSLWINSYINANSFDDISIDKLLKFKLDNIVIKQDNFDEVLEEINNSVDELIGNKTIVNDIIAKEKLFKLKSSKELVGYAIALNDSKNSFLEFKQDVIINLQKYHTIVTSYVQNFIDKKVKALDEERELEKKTIFDEQTSRFNLEKQEFFKNVSNKLDVEESFNNLNQFYAFISEYIENKNNKLEMLNNDFYSLNEKYKKHINDSKDFEEKIALLEKKVEEKDEELSDLNSVLTISNKDLISKDDEIERLTKELEFQKNSNTSKNPTENEIKADYSDEEEESFEEEENYEEEESFEEEFEEVAEKKPSKKKEADSIENDKKFEEKPTKKKLSKNKKILITIGAVIVFLVAVWSALVSLYADDVEMQNNQPQVQRMLPSDVAPQTQPVELQTPIAVAPSYDFEREITENELKELSIDLYNNDFYKIRVNGKDFQKGEIINGFKFIKGDNLGRILFIKDDKLVYVDMKK
jgi:alkylhydroperoxidase/carboxymuconolactone decarboxylase family protein YurZ